MINTQVELKLNQSTKEKEIEKLFRIKKVIQFFLIRRENLLRYYERNGKISPQ